MQMSDKNKNQTREIEMSITRSKSVIQFLQVFLDAHSHEFTYTVSMDNATHYLYRIKQIHSIATTVATLQKSSGCLTKLYPHHSFSNLGDGNRKEHKQSMLFEVSWVG